MNSVIQVGPCSSMISLLQNYLDFQCLSNTKLLTNYLLSDEHVREINSTSSSMKGSLVKGKLQQSHCIGFGFNNSIFSFCHRNQRTLEGQWSRCRSLQFERSNTEICSKIFRLQPGGFSGVPQISVGGTS